MTDDTTKIDELKREFENAVTCYAAAKQQLRVAEAECKFTENAYYGAVYGLHSGVGLALTDEFFASLNQRNPGAGEWWKQYGQLVVVLVTRDFVRVSTSITHQIASTTVEIEIAQRMRQAWLEQNGGPE